MRTEVYKYVTSISLFLTITGCDFTTYNDAINYFDSTGAVSGNGRNPVPGRYSQWVYKFWDNVVDDNWQIYFP